MILQLFVRDNVPAEFGENVYMVCGLIRSDTPLVDECVHLFHGSLNDIDIKDCSAVTRGNSLDGVMKSAIWRKFTTKK